jgi:hypothetical protein
MTAESELGKRLRYHVITFAIHSGRLLPYQHSPAQLVEEVEQHRHVNRAPLFASCIRSGKHGKALAVRREVQVLWSTRDFEDLRVGPGARFVVGQTHRLSRCRQ